MSFQEYLSAAPAAISTAPPIKTNDSEHRVVPSTPGPLPSPLGKGYIDIVELQRKVLDGHESEFTPTNRFSPEGKRLKKEIQEKKYSEYALILRRVWREAQQGAPYLVSVELEIQSPSLCDEFRKLVKATYDGSNLQTNPIKLRMPFYELFFHRETIKEALEDMSRSQQLRNDLQLLNDFIPKHGVLSSIVDDHEKYKLQKQVVGDIVWTMFPQHPDGGQNEVRFSAHPLQVLNIRDLPAIPMAYYEDWDELQQTLQKRARSLEAFLGGRLDSYHCYSADYDSVIKEDEPSINIDERVMADWATFLAKNLQGADTLYEFTNTQSSTTETGEGHEGRDFIAAGQQVFDQPRRVPVTKPSKAKRRKVKTLNDLRTAVEAEFGISKDCVDLLFPAEVPVFALKEKKWMWALSDSLRPPEWNKTAFDSLQMKVETKKLIEGLVRGHMEVSFDDVIQGKGQGLIFLLHGAPGLGKTLTAESVADLLTKPLYSISGGELGTDVARVDERLSEIFRLGKRWKAVCLLDEADVLLCRRISAEIERNAIVGVFLRKIEYFQGVLFLTTNRKEDLDEAFKSRIHVTITKKTSTQIDDSWTSKVFETLGELQLNGRIIKNILRTAFSYANSTGEALGVHHVRDIAETELGEDDDDGRGEPNVQRKAALEELTKLVARKPQSTDNHR
ncbi:hypothetical protein ACCO45_003925 [Purpureocillium lilacinum]|uniref:Uncharacterized protein n=1 Tax=Purpureocillium lilacinum TaxID=33203 RepID=A0ACC4E2K6_PURLI